MEDLRLRVVNVGHGIHVGHRDACDAGAGEHMPTLHIWRKDMHPGSSCRICQNVMAGERPLRKGGCILEYQDGDSFHAALILGAVHTHFDQQATFNYLYDWFTLGHCNDAVLVHCTVGQTRGPTLAFFGKLARGATLAEAMGDVFSATYQSRGITVNWCLNPVSEIVVYFSRRGLLNAV